MQNFILLLKKIYDTSSTLNIIPVIKYKYFFQLNKSTSFTKNVFIRTELHFYMKSNTLVLVNKMQKKETKNNEIKCEFIVISKDMYQ